MNEQSRINAMISYFLLGPLFLLAKSGTPLREPFVRSHAFRASIIMGIALSIYCVYILFIRVFLDISLLGIQLHSIILSIISGGTILLLLQGAYGAYHGKTSEHETEFSLGHIFLSRSNTLSIENEDDKVRLVASMIPFLGIYMARRYPHPLIIRGRVIGSTLAIIMILSSIFSTLGGPLLDIMMIASILFILAIAVNLFIRGELIVSRLMEYLPTYEEIEAHIFASIGFLGEFSRVIFGGEHRETYHTLYIRELSRKGEPRVSSQEYFMPPSLIGLPIWNIFCIPSLWIEKYRDFRVFIISGLLITLCSIGIVLLMGNTSSYLLLLLFPIIHMMSYARSDIGTYIPGVHILIRIVGLFSRSKQQIQETSETTSINFQYPTKDGEDQSQAKTETVG